LNFEGNYLLAKLFAAQVALQLPAAIAAQGKSGWAAVVLCDRRLAVSVWDRYRVWQVNFSRVSEPPFTEHVNDVPRARRYMARLDQLRSQMTSNGRTQAQVLYEEAVKAVPEDPSLCGNYAQFLGEVGNFAAAVEQQQRVCELLPQSAAAFHKQGLLLVRKGDVDAARERFLQALTLRADYVPALNELGLIAAHQQKSAHAQNALRKRSRSIRATRNVFESGIPGATGGKPRRGYDQFSRRRRTPARWSRGSFQQRDHPARESSTRGCRSLLQAACVDEPVLAGALPPWSDWRCRKKSRRPCAVFEIVRLRPDFAKGHVNLGIALAKRQKLDEARWNFRRRCGESDQRSGATRSGTIGILRDRK
jgi:Flp pilus assembly protein TadD